MELSPTAAYHVERAGPDGRDLAVVFEGRRSSAALGRTAATVRDTPADAEADIPLSAGDRQRRAASPPESDDRAHAAPAAAAPRRQGRRAKPAPRRAPLPARPAPSAATAADAAGRRSPRRTAPRAATQPPSAPPTVNTQLPGTRAEEIHRAIRSARLPGRGSALGAPRRSRTISGLNMIIDPPVQGRVDIVLNDVPWDQALDTILRTQQARVRRSRARSSASRRWPCSPTSRRSSAS